MRVEEDGFDYTKRSRKDTNRWCRGKPGKKHKVVHKGNHKGRECGVDMCGKCGKVFKIHYNLKAFNWDNSCNERVEGRNE